LEAGVGEARTEWKLSRETMDKRRVLAILQDWKKE
jgi:hypothetical protein